MLINPVYNPTQNTPTALFAVHKQAFHSIAKCVAALTVKSSSDASGVVNQFVKDVRVGLLVVLIIFADFHHFLDILCKFDHLYQLVFSRKSKDVRIMH